MNKTITLTFIISLILGLFACSSTTQKEENNEKTEIIVFHAGSLSVPFKEIAKSLTCWGLQPNIQ